MTVEFETDTYTEAPAAIARTHGLAYSHAHLSELVHVYCCVCVIPYFGYDRAATADEAHQCTRLSLPGVHTLRAHTAHTHAHTHTHTHTHQHTHVHRL